MIVHSGPVTVQHGPLHRTITITLPGHAPIHMTRRDAHRIAYDLQDIIAPAPRTNIADIGYKTCYGAGVTIGGDYYLIADDLQYTLDDEHQARQLLTALAHHLDRGVAVRVAYQTLILIAVGAALAAVTGAMIWVAWLLLKAGS